MDRSVLLLALISLACASTGGTTGPDLAEDAVYEVEASLREAEAAIDAGDKQRARTLIAEVEGRIKTELGGTPDRHQLSAQAEALRARIDRPSVFTAAFAAPEVAPAAPVEPVVAEEEKEESSGDAAAIAAFEEGPLKDRGRALDLLSTAKRASKKKSRRLVKEARALLASCATEGARLMEASPDLEEKTFKLGDEDLSARSIVGECKSKMESFDRTKKKKKSKRKFRQS